MLISNLYTIEVTEDIATKIRTMAETGCFSMRNGSIELHYDAEGNIANVITHTHQRIQKVIPTSVHNEVAVKGVIV